MECIEAIMTIVGVKGMGASLLSKKPSNLLSGVMLPP